MTLAINSANYLSSRIGLATSAASGTGAPTHLAAGNVNPTEDTLELRQQSNAYLLLRDTVTEYSAMVAVVQVTGADLDNLGNYLTDIQTRLQMMETLEAGSDGWLATQSEIDALEVAMSQYLGARVAQTPEVVMNYDDGGRFQEQYFSTLDLGMALPGLDSSELAVLEVDIGSLMIKAHSPSSCPVCAALAGESNDPSLVPLAAPTTNTTSVTGAVASAASGTSYIETLRMGAKWDLSSGETLSYSYYNGNVAYSGYPVSVGGIDPGSAATSMVPLHESNLDAAFAAWDAVAAFAMEKVTEAGTAVGELRTAYTSSAQTPANAAAFAYGPGISSVNGDIWFDVSQASNQNFTAGGYGYMTALHEIGHALGLSHPFGGSASGATLSATYDNIRNTLMSYTNTDRNLVLTVTSTGNGLWTANMSTGIYASTPMLYDVAAIEYLYGASTSTHATDTVYSWSDAPKIMETIIDSGGTDTIDASGQSRASVINLNAGSFSSIGYWSEADQLSYYQNLYGGTTATQLAAYITNVNTAYNVTNALYTGQDNLGIAYSAVIENAIGGAGNDTFTGNSADNRIEGNAGNDTFDGGGGTDTAIFNGAYANYTITTSGATTTVADGVGTDGTDTLSNVRYLEFSDLTWDLSTNTQVSAGGSGGTGVTTSASFDGRRYVGQRDKGLSGSQSGGNSAGSNTLIAVSSRGPDILQSAATNRIAGGAGNDQLIGTDGNDLLEAGAGNDLVYAGAGDDLIVGGNGEGNDTYFGGTGNDTIRYSSARSGITVNLQQGSAGSTGGGDAAGIGTDTLSEIENIIGGRFDDVLIGDANDNQIAGNGGNDRIDGGAGNDTAVFSGARSAYTVSAGEGGYVVSSSKGEKVRVINVEFLRFSDGTYQIALPGKMQASGQPHGVGGISLRTREDASAALGNIDKALSYVNEQRSALGAIMNVLEARGNVLTAEKTNTYAARSRIMDTNYAYETAALARQMVLLNAGQAMLAMANKSGQDVMALLR